MPKRSESLARPRQTSELFLRMMHEIPVRVDGTSSGVDHGPEGLLAKDIRVDIGERTATEHCWSLGQERQELPLLPQSHGGPHWLPGSSPKLLVKYITYSPEGARATFGS